MSIVRPDSDAVSRDEVQVDVCLYVIVLKCYTHIDILSVQKACTHAQLLSVYFSR